MKMKDGGFKIKYFILKIESVDDYFLIVINNVFYSSCLFKEFVYLFIKI